MLLGVDSDISSDDQAGAQTQYAHLRKHSNIVVMYFSLINFVKK